MLILVVGENFACGRGRKGDLAYLSALGEQFGFTVQPQPLHAPHGAPSCSSTETRRLIQLGELTETARLLDRSQEMTGVAMEETGANQSNRHREVVDANLGTPQHNTEQGDTLTTDQDQKSEE